MSNTGEEEAMSERRVVLLRGVNVGRAKRVAMAELRALVEELGYRDVRTLLNSGNIVFSVSDGGDSDAAARIEDGLASRLGVSARVTVLTAGELALVIAENPLVEPAVDPSRLLVAFLADSADRVVLDPLAGPEWAPEAFAVGAQAAYLWCPGGVTGSRLFAAVGRALGDAVTTRNWATVLKLQVLAAAGDLSEANR